MDHLDQLVLDVRRAGDAVHVGDLGRRADQHVAEAGLAHVRAAVVAREALDQRAGHVDLAVHEHVLPRHEHLVEVDQDLLAAVDGVALVDRAGLHRAQVRGLPAVDVGDADRVDRDRGDHGVVSLVGGQSPWSA